MADLIGCISISLIFVITFFIASRWRGISNILFAAFTLRLLLLLVNHYILPLPDSDADAKSFENFAWFLAQDGFKNVLKNYTGPNSYFISWLIAIPYSLFGRSLLMAKSLSLLFGMGCVFLGYSLSKKIWDIRIANKVGWIIALFPSLNLYSVLILREVYVSFFLLVAFYGIINWTKNNNFKSFIVSIIGFIGATFFHGAIFIGIIVFFIIIFLISSIKLLKSLKKRRLKIINLFYFLITITVLALYLSNQITISKLGNFEKILKIENLLQSIENYNVGDASYPEWTIPKSPIELFYKGPIRIIYFLFAPFPWDIKNIYHLIGFFDGLLYMCLAILIFINIKATWKNPALKIILLILLTYFFVFGLTVGNFGTGIRHKSKFVIPLILLAGPLLPKFLLLKK